MVSSFLSVFTEDNIANDGFFIHVFLKSSLFQQKKNLRYERNDFVRSCDICQKKLQKFCLRCGFFSLQILTN